jgi:hypothetical protein
MMPAKEPKNSFQLRGLSKREPRMRGEGTRFTEQWKLDWRPMWRWPGKTKLTHLSDTVPQTGVTEHAITNAGRIYQTNDILGKDVLVWRHLNSADTSIPSNIHASQT